MSLLDELTAAYRERCALRDRALESFADTYIQRARQAVQALRPTVEFSTAEMVEAWAEMVDSWAGVYEHSDIMLYIGDTFRREGLQVTAEARKVSRFSYDTILIVSGWTK